MRPEEGQRRAAVFEGWRCYALLCFAQAEEDGRDSQSFAPALFGVTLGLFGEAPEEKWLRTRREIFIRDSLPFTELLHRKLLGDMVILCIHRFLYWAHGIC
jgi:hypothetical protein